MKKQKRSKTKINSPRIAIIMPIYNEGSSISHTLLEINDKIIKNTKNVKVLIFEDGSTDNTKSVLRKLAGRYKWLEIHLGPVRLGYPKAVSHAFASIDEKKFDYIMFIDSDGQYDPRDFFRMLSVMNKGGVDMVVAQRLNRTEPLYRVVLSKGLHVIERTLFSIKYADVTSAFRLMDLKVAKRVASKVKFSNTNFWLEFTARAAMQNVRTAIIFVSYRNRVNGGKSKVYSIRRIPKAISGELVALIKTRLEGAN